MNIKLIRLIVIKLHYYKKKKYIIHRLQQFYEWPLKNAFNYFV